MIKKAFLSKLKKAYKEHKLVPFIGTGLSTPFNIPDWGNLILRVAEEYVDYNLIAAVKQRVINKNYWGAIELIKEFGEASDRDIQEMIAEIIKGHMNKEIEQEEHNYLDLSKGEFSNILTTNYDLLITKYFNDPLIIPQVLYKVKINSQLTFDYSDNKTKVWHLHGHIQDPDSIIISREKYDELYSNEQYKKIFEIFQAQGVLIFIGFSMNDNYIKQLIEKNSEYFNCQHYILLDKPGNELKKELKDKYFINVIEYDSSDGGHAYQIRKILNEIMQEDLEEEDLHEDEDEKKNR